jgi:hypothetical protein
VLFSIKKDYELHTGTKIKHVFAEPPSAEKHKRGIGLELPFSDLCPGVVALSPPDGFQGLSNYEWHKHDIAHRFPIREDYWITQIGDEIHKSVLFICGALHICTFKERLERKDIRVDVIADSVGCLPMYKNSDAYKALQDVRKNGFPPVLIGTNSQCFCTMQQDIPSVIYPDLE